MEQQWKNLTAHGIVWKKQSVTNSSAGGLAIHLKATCWVSRRKRNPKKRSSWDGQTFTDRKKKKHIFPTMISKFKLTALFFVPHLVLKASFSFALLLSTQYPILPYWAMFKPRTTSTKLFAFRVLYSLFTLTPGSHHFSSTPTPVFLHSPSFFRAWLHLMGPHFSSSRPRAIPNLDKCPQTNYLIKIEVNFQ